MKKRFKRIKQVKKCPEMMIEVTLTTFKTEILTLTSISDL